MCILHPSVQSYASNGNKPCSINWPKGSLIFVFIKVRISPNGFSAEVSGTSPTVTQPNSPVASVSIRFCRTHKNVRRVVWVIWHFTFNNCWGGERDSEFRLCGWGISGYIPRAKRNDLSEFKISGKIYMFGSTTQEIAGRNLGITHLLARRHDVVSLYPLVSDKWLRAVSLVFFLHPPTTFPNNLCLASLWNYYEQRRQC